MERTMRDSSKEKQTIKSIMVVLLWVFYLYFAIVFGTLGIIYYVHDFPTTSIGWNQVLRN